MLRNFSIGYNMEKQKKREERKKTTSSLEDTLRKSFTNKANKTALNEEVAETMLSFGNIDY